jgi:hypothetical protein
MSWIGCSCEDKKKSNKIRGWPSERIQWSVLQCAPSHIVNAGIAIRVDNKYYSACFVSKVLMCSFMICLSYFLYRIVTRLLMSVKNVWGWESLTYVILNSMSQVVLTIHGEQILIEQHIYTILYLFECANCLRSHVQYTSNTNEQSRHLYFEDVCIHFLILDVPLSFDPYLHWSSWSSMILHDSSLKSNVAGQSVLIQR